MDTKEKIKELYKLKRELLMHMVGMDYNTQKALEIKEQIKKLEKKDVK